MSVGGALLCMQRRIPFLPSPHPPTRSIYSQSFHSFRVLCTYLANAYFSSPGDSLKPGEDEIESQFDHGINNEWEIGDCLAQ